MDKNKILELLETLRNSIESLYDDNEFSYSTYSSLIDEVDEIVLEVQK